MTNFVTLDDFDHKLLMRVRRNNLEPARVTAEAVGLSESAVLRRLRRLRAEGVIQADVAIIAPEALGRPVQVLVQVSLERERADIIDRFKAAIRKTPEIMTGYYVTGEADFILVVTARDMADYEQFTRRFFYENSHIKGFKTMVVIDRVKAGFALPVD